MEFVSRNIDLLKYNTKEKNPYFHPTRSTTGCIGIRTVNRRAKYNELIKYCIDNYIIHNIYSKGPIKKNIDDTGLINISLKKFNNHDNWRWLCKYKYDLNDSYYQ